MFSRVYQLITSAIVAIGALTAVAAVSLIERHGRELYENHLSSLIASLEHDATAWARQETLLTSEIATRANVVRAAQDLLRADEGGEALVGHEATDTLRAYFRPLFEAGEMRGFFVISPDGKNLSSYRDVNIGLPSFLNTPNGRLREALDGQTIVSNIVQTDVPIARSTGQSLAYSIFSLAPIRSEDGKVIAALTIRFDPFVTLFPEVAATRSLDFNSYLLLETGELIFSSEGNESGAFSDTNAEQNTGEAPTFARKTLDDVAARRAGLDVKGYLTQGGQTAIGGWEWIESLGMALVVQAEEPAWLRFLAAIKYTIWASVLAFGSLTLLLQFLLYRRSKALVAIGQENSAIIRSTDDAMVVFQDDGQILRGNPAFNRMFDYPEVPKGAVGIFAIIRPDADEPDDETTLLTELMRSGKNGRDLRGISRSGREFPVFVTCAKLSEKKVWLATIRDETGRHREQKLQQALANANSALEAKSRFLSLISHELRSPLIGISTALGLVGEKLAKGAERDFVTKAERSADLLLSIIDDILDFSRLDLGKVTPKIELTDPIEILREVIDLQSWQAAAADVRLEWKVEPGIPALLTDPQKYRQILLKLVGNAIKFTAGHGKMPTVSISLSMIRSDNNRQLLCTKVHDNGVGMDRMSVSRILEPFQQGDNSIQRKYGGTGLGLAIAKELSELLGGGLSVSSEIGKGTEFEVCLPLEPMTLPKPGQTLDSTSDRPMEVSDHILLVEDDMLIREVMLRRLEALGLSVDTAVNGSEALELWKEKWHKVVISDCHMPIMDGFQLSQAIRDHEGHIGRDKKTMIVAVSADTDSDIENRCRVAGIDHFVPKPLDKDALDRLFRKPAQQ